MCTHGKICHCPLVRSSTTQRQFPHRVHSSDVDRKGAEHAVHLAETLLSALKDKA
jgi:hypothetical protein